jgi:hypothetical protein
MQRLHLGAVDDKSGFLAGAACRDMDGMAIEPWIEQHHRPVHRHALRAVHGAGIGPAEPGSSAFVGDLGGTEADVTLADDRFNAGAFWSFAGSAWTAVTVAAVPLTTPS